MRVIGTNHNLRGVFLVKLMLVMAVVVLMIGVGTLALENTHALQPALHISIDGRPVAFSDAPPYIDDNNRTMVPVRFISEELGAKVTWNDKTKTVIITQEHDVIMLQINSREMWVNGDTKEMDSHMVLNREFRRNYVPLRFVSENLGATLQVTQSDEGMFIKITQVEVLSPTGIKSLSIGSTEAHVRETLGEPERVELTPYGYHWWVYGKEEGPYQLVGMENGKVVSFYTNSDHWHYQGIGIGTRMEEARKKLNYQQDLTFRLGPTRYEFSQPYLNSDVQQDLFLVDERTLITLYYDIHENQRVTAVRFTPLSLIPKTANITIVWTYVKEFPPDHSLPVLSRKQKESVDRGNEQIMFDLVNSVRRQKGLPVLTWDEAISHVAFLHSVDMVENEFFDHISPNTGNPGDRMRKGNITYAGYRENLALGQVDAMDAHEGLMNSLGHRENILDRQVTSLGVGVFQRSYTQNYVY